MRSESIEKEVLDEDEDVAASMVPQAVKKNKIFFQWQALLRMAAGLLRICAGCSRGDSGS